MSRPRLLLAVVALGLAAGCSPEKSPADGGGAVGGGAAGASGGAAGARGYGGSAGAGGASGSVGRGGTTGETGVGGSTGIGGSAAAGAGGTISTGSGGGTNAAAGASGRGGGGSAGTSGASTLAVTTNRYDNARSGVNLQETTLTTSNVNANQFGLLFSRTVDGQIYAQPLYVGGLTMADKKVHNVVYVATEHNTVYAFDADDATASAPLWSLNVGPSGTNSCDNLEPEIGITSTPVIDEAAGTIYFISKGQEAGAWVQRIHAVNIVTGAERTGSPMVIAASVKGTGAGTSGGTVAFNAATQLNRPGLLLVNGIVYAAFASHCDAGVYHGWLLGYTYDGTKFQQSLAFNVSPNGSQGGIWQGGVGLSSDGTSIYVVAGNGSTNPSATALDLSESVFRLRLSDYSVQDYWIPTGYSSLNAADADLSSGAILLPHNLLLTGSKDGRLYVLDATNLGKYSATADNILQTLTTPGKANGAQGHVHGGAIYYDAPAGTGEKVFLWPEDSPLMEYTLNPTTRTLNGLVTDPIPTASFTPGHPGAVLTLSANGAVAGTGILWASLPTQNGTNGAWHTTSAGALYAVDATNITHVLWSDSLGSWNVAKFAPPVVANGHVYLGTFSNSLRVYGLTN
ncbi:MAG TPA: PQQ-binding-like beta-propeller repeat protein [Polyangia bacterium]|nr:PQQ-binding-like beta-propeller repeat protein [Polyangia bacterium]